MPFTTREIIKKHILDHHIGSTIVANEAVQLNGMDVAQLEKRMILPSSECVKAKEQNEPTQQAVSFASGDLVGLTHAKIIPDSVVVASDSSLGRIYIENIDYHIDYSAGNIGRLPAGSILAGANVVVWFLYYRLFQRGGDYQIDYQGGTIRRYIGGDIESGQLVLVDYTAEYGSLDDAAIDNAISEADEQIISFIDEGYRESPDQALVTAETYLAVSIICRIRGMESISPSNKKPGTSGDAQSWVAISESYRMEAYNILSRFARLVAPYKSPSKA